MVGKGSSVPTGAAVATIKWNVSFGYVKNIPLGLVVNKC